MNKIVWYMIAAYPKIKFLNEHAADLVSQLESICILVTVIYMLLLIGIMAYNTFSKLEKRSKFFRGFKNKFSSSDRSNNRTRSRNRSWRKN